MQRLMVLAAFLVLILLGFRVAAHEGASVAGRLSATEMEADEGYFAIDQDTMVVVKPGSALHAWLRGHSGERVRLTVIREPESE